MGPLVIPLAMMAASAIAGGIQQERANKQRRLEQQKMQQDQLKAQQQLNEQNQQLGMKTWNDTNYGAQRKQMENAGLNVGMMYGGGGQGGQTQTFGGSIGMGQPEEQGKAGRDWQGLGMMGAEQLELLRAQKENIQADTQQKQVQTEKTAGVDTQNVTLDNRLKTVQAEISEATTNEQLRQVWSKTLEAEQDTLIKATQLGTMNETQREEIAQARLRTAQLGVEIEAKKAGIALTEAQTQETAKKINKIVAEIERMENMTEIQKEQLLQQKMQVEFNTSTPAQIKQWTSIGTDIMNATKGGTTINKNGTEIQHKYYGEQ